MNLRSMTAIACLALGLAACSKPAEKAEETSPAAAVETAPALAPTISDLKIAPGDSIEEIMANHVDVAGDFMFGSIQDIADDTGAHRKQPQTPEEWNDVREALLVLHDSPNFMITAGRLSAKPESRADYPQVELQPEAANKLVVDERTSFVVKAKAMQDAAAAGLKAVDAKDADALYKVIETIDVACESCHLQFWYPNDERAKEAARKQGIID